MTGTLTLGPAALLDCTGRQTRPVAGMTVDGNRIAQIAEEHEHLTRPPGEAAVDCTGLTLLPGLMDLHSHMGVVSLDAAAPISAAMTAALLFENAQACIASGYTTAREVGGADTALKVVIDAGYINGPRLYPSGPLLCQSAGHGDMNSPWAQHHHARFGIPGLAQLSLVCDGPDEVRRGAREAFRRGATQIKVCISGGVVSHTDQLTDTQFTIEELRAAVAEAKSRGTYVTGHALNSAAVMLGLDAGLECFEHGINLDEKTAAAVREAGASIVATLAVTHLLATEPQAMGVPETFSERLGSLARDARESLGIAYQAGVRLGSGTDILGPVQSRRGMEIPLKAAVIGAMPALIAATRTNAEIIRQNNHLGTLEAGKIADIIGVSGDPLTEPELFNDPGRVELVIKDGIVVKDIRGRALDVFSPRLGV